MDACEEMAQRELSYGLDFNTLDGSSKVIQKVRWVIVCRDTDA